MSDLSVSTELVRVLYCSFSSSVSLLSSKSLSLSPPLPFKISASSCACFDVSCALALSSAVTPVSDIYLVLKLSTVAEALLYAASFSCATVSKLILLLS